EGRGNRLHPPDSESPQGAVPAPGDDDGPGTGVTQVVDGLPHLSIGRAVTQQSVAGQILIAHLEQAERSSLQEGRQLVTVEIADRGDAGGGTVGSQPAVQVHGETVFLPPAGDDTDAGGHRVLEGPGIEVVGLVPVEIRRPGRGEDPSLTMAAVVDVSGG